MRLISPLLLFTLASPAISAWTTLPPTPPLPAPITDTTTPINGVRLWSQKYNEAAGGTPIILIHGGLGYSAYFGSVIAQLSRSRYVIAVDRRGHGRSTYAGANEKFSFEQFARDTKAHLAAMGVSKGIWVGWSDGAATTLAGLLDSAIAATIEKAFVFAGFQSWRDTNATFVETGIYKEFLARCAKEYAQLQPGASFTDFATRVGALEGTMPNWSDADLAKIEGAKVTIAGADHDEAVNLAVPAHLNSVIKGSKLKMLTGVSHFAPVQDPGQFARAVMEIL